MRWFLWFTLLSIGSSGIHAQKIFREGTITYRDGSERTGLIFYNNVLRHDDRISFRSGKKAEQETVDLSRIEQFSIGNTERYVVRTVTEKLQDEYGASYYRTEPRVLRHLEAGPLNLYQFRGQIGDWLYLAPENSPYELTRLEVIESTLDENRQVASRDTLGTERLREGGMYMVSRHHLGVLRRMTTDCPTPQKEFALKPGNLRAAVDRYNRCRQGRSYERRSYFRNGLNVYVSGGYVNARQFFSEEDRRDGTAEFGAEISFPTAQNNFSISFALQPVQTWSRETIARRFRRTANAGTWKSRTSWVRVNYYFLNEQRYQPYVAVGFVNRVLLRDGVAQDEDIASALLAAGVRMNVQDRFFPHLELRVPNAPAVRLGAAFRLF